MTSGRIARTAAATIAFLFAAVATFGGCSGGSSTPSDSAAGGTGAGSCTNGGGPVPGDADQHCTDADGNPIVQEVRAAACMDSGAAGTASTGDAGGAGAVEEAAPVLFNSDGDDDDCKYHISFSATCVERNKDVTITVHVNARGDDSPVVGAETQTEIYLSDTHLAPNTRPITKIISPGVYSVGPVRFDQAGRWTVRFHFFETCLDAREDSPHGHAAFYVDVP